MCTGLLYIRILLCNWRNPFNSKIRIVALVGVAVFLGILYTDVVGTVSSCPPSKHFLWKFEMDTIMQETERLQLHIMENVTILFMLLLVSLLNSMLSIVVTFGDEVAVLRREYDNYSYTVLSFYIAKLVADMHFTLPTTALFVVIVHRLTGQLLDSWFRLLLCVTPCCLITFTGQLIGE